MQLLANNHAMVQVFSVQGCTAGLHRRRDDQAVPKREIVPFYQ